MATVPYPSRRAFMGSLGALSALGASRLDPAAAHGQAPINPRQAGALAPVSDFLLEPGLVYLQTGSLGPSPRSVMQRTVAAWQELERNPTFYAYGLHERAMEDVRAKAAAFLGCATNDLVLTRSTTEGMNWVAQGLHLTAGDHVLTTDQEHPGGRVCWDYLVRTAGIVLDIVTIPPGTRDALAILDGFARAITPRTRVLSFSHLLSSTGLRLPVAALSALARERGCLAVVDGAQAVGGIAVDVKALGCHVYATSGHKWLLGPKGTGLLYLSEEAGRRIDPFALEGGRAAYSASSGVTNIPGVLGLGAAIDYITDIGIAAVERHNLALGARLHDALSAMPQVRVVSAPPGELASPLVTFALPEKITGQEMQARLLNRHKVMVKVVPKQWLDGNRLSTHLFNTSADVEAFVAALRTELGGLA